MVASAFADAQRLLTAGADKIAVNSAAVERPLLSELSDAFGKQCTVISIDAARRDDRSWDVVTHSGKTDLACVPSKAVDAVHRGAGEILLTSWDQDGTREGYDLELISRFAKRSLYPSLRQAVLTRQSI